MKATINRFIRSKFVWGLFTQTIIKIIATALGLYTTRWLINYTSQEVYANYTVIISFVSIIISSTDWGIARLTQKYFTNQEGDSQLGDFWTTINLSRLFTYLVGLVMITATFQLVGLSDLILILWIFSMQFLLVIDLNYRAVCDAKGHTWQFSITDLLGRLILVALLFAFPIVSSYLNWPGLEYFLATTTFTYILTLLIDSIWQAKHVRWGKLNKSILLSHFKPMIYLGLASTFAALYLHFKQILLDNFGFSDEILGSFFNATKVFMLATIVPGMTVPMIVSLVKKRINQSKTTRVSSFLQEYLSTKNAIIVEWSFYMLAFCVGLFGGLMIFGPFILYLIDPENKYPQATEALYILSISMLFWPLIKFYSDLIVFSGGAIYELWVTFMLAVIGIALFIWLIPTYGIYGASWATVVVYLIDLLLRFGVLTLGKKSLNA